VIFSNKIIFKYYPFPTGLTMMHELLGYAITTTILSYQAPPEDFSGAHAKKTRWQRMRDVLPIAAAVTGNNYFSNMAIQTSSVATAQTVKAIVPAFTLVIYKVFHSREYPAMNYMAITCVCLGVIVTTSQDSTLTVQGCCAGVMASFCAASKVVLANAQGKRLTPVEASNQMAPFNILLLACVFWWSELSLLHTYADQLFTPKNLGLALLHGLLVFGLQQAGIFSTAVNSPVIQTTAGNMKLVFVYLFCWLLYDEHLSPSKLVGCLLTLIGGLWYGLLQQGFRSIQDLWEAAAGALCEDKDKEA